MTPRQPIQVHFLQSLAWAILFTGPFTLQDWGTLRCWAPQVLVGWGWW